MMHVTIDTLRAMGFAGVHRAPEAVNCHHNYVRVRAPLRRERDQTRKGAVRARPASWHHPGKMGARSFIVRGKGNRRSPAAATARAAR
jgi:tRNA-splicing ligase RtcB